MEENVNHPQHYNQHPSGVECIDIARYYPFAIGNAIKYLWRAGLKKDAALEDVEKEIEEITTTTIARLGATTMKDMGKVMSYINKTYVGQVDGSMVSRIVKSKLS